MTSNHCLTVLSAAYVAFVESKVLRNWLDKRGFALVGTPDRGMNDRIRLAPVDVIRVALTGRLLRYGFSLAEAVGILADVLPRFLPLHAASPDISFDELVEGLADCHFGVIREQGGMVIFWQTPDETSEPPAIDYALVLDAGRIAVGCRNRWRLTRAMGKRADQLARCVAPIE
jgi:hypothetical protein